MSGMFPHRSVLMKAGHGSMDTCLVACVRGSLADLGSCGEHQNLWGIWQPHLHPMASYSWLSTVLATGQLRCCFLLQQCWEVLFFVFFFEQDVVKKLNIESLCKVQIAFFIRIS